MPRRRVVRAVGVADAIPRLARTILAGIALAGIGLTGIPVVGVPSSTMVAAAATEPGSYTMFRPPTGAPVLDPFRLPAGAYGPGNRGIEYATSDGEPVVAAADGTVSFAGAVAGSLFVSIDHPGGLRSTAGFVRQVLVRRGAQVRTGEVVAVAGGPFHFTVRLHGEYIDPAPLFGLRRVHVRLVALPSRNAGVVAGGTAAPATLSGGPFGPRTVPDRQRWIMWVRATPGRFGVLHEHETGKKEQPWQSSP